MTEAKKLYVYDNVVGRTESGRTFTHGMILFKDMSDDEDLKCYGYVELHPLEEDNNNVTKE